MVEKKLFSGVYKDKKVLVTGHTGFKGSWLVYWLEQMGANVVGYSLPPPTQPNHIDLLQLDIVSIVGDIRDADMLHRTIAEHNPDIVFHLAAQALVRQSYKNPLETYETNVLGTLKVLEACRKNRVNAVVNITSDKAYENKEWVWGYRETDRLGGYDPYSSSKGCADILVNSYRDSFFNNKDYKKTHHTAIAGCRAGNVIGGGDWAEDRLIPDIMVAASKNKTVSIRNPQATRPWQHVLEPLSGYLQVGQKLLEEQIAFAEAWNFGPNEQGNIAVESVIRQLQTHWEKIRYNIQTQPHQPYEATLLKLDCSKAHQKLQWDNVWDSKTTLEKTAEWYKRFYDQEEISTSQDLNSYIKDAEIKEITWVNC